MRIAHLKISNILGIEDLEFDAGAFNEVAGPNGHGKTSILEAIKAVFQTGHDATLLRRGAEQGEVVLVLDDGVALRKRVKADASDTQMRRDGKLVAKPAAAIKDLVDALAVNPVDFLRAPKKDRARVLLESMPVHVDIARLAAITGLANPCGSAEGLAAIDAARQTVYDERTGTNRSVRDKESTISQLQAAMPEPAGSVEGDEIALQGMVDAAATQRDAELERIRTKLADIEFKARDQSAIRHAAANEQIEAIRRGLADAEAAASAKLTETRSAAAAQRELTISKYSRTVEPINASRTAIAANRDAVAKRRITQETIATLQAELEALAQNVAAHTKALDAIDDYKAEILASLPIPGVEVVGGDITRDGVAFDRLNTAQQVEIAVQIARLRSGKLGVVCVDGIELLNTASYEEFRRQALDSGLQLFVSRVNDDDAMSIAVTN